MEEKKEKFFACHKLLFDYFYVWDNDGNVERRQTEYHVLGYREDDDLEQEANLVFNIFEKLSMISKMLSSSIKFCFPMKKITNEGQEYNFYSICSISNEQLFTNSHCWFLGP